MSAKIDLAAPRMGLSGSIGIASLAWLIQNRRVKCEILEVAVKKVSGLSNVGKGKVVHMTWSYPNRGGLSLLPLTMRCALTVTEPALKRMNAQWIRPDQLGHIYGIL